jgi:hypothetical protein
MRSLKATVLAVIIALISVVYLATNCSQDASKADVTIAHKGVTTENLKSMVQVFELESAALSFDAKLQSNPLVVNSGIQRVETEKQTLYVVSWIEKK